MNSYERQLGVRRPTTSAAKPNKNTAINEESSEDSDGRGETEDKAHHD